MTLTDAELVAAGNAALRLLDLPETAEPDSVGDGTVFIAAWLPGEEELVSSNGVWLDGTPQEAALAVLDGITNDISETDAFYAVAFPRCPGHAHPADYGGDGRDGGDLWLSCPQTGTEIRRVTV